MVAQNAGAISLESVRSLINPDLSLTDMEIKFEKKARFESSANPEVERLTPILETLSPSRPSVESGFKTNTSAPATQSLGPNLILNPSVEVVGSGGVPANWFKGGYGANTRSLIYPVTGHASPKGVRVTISNYTSGDAKWYFTDVAVTPGKVYQFSDYYVGNAPSIATARFLMTNGTYTYQNIASRGPAAGYTNLTAQFTAPANSVSVTIFHLIKQVGTLTTDSFSLNEVTQSPSDNLVANPDFESGATGQPTSWNKGGWGTNTRVFTYPATGMGGSRAGRVAISSYTSGDAKWYFNPVTVSRGIYTYETSYISNITSYLTVRYQNQDDSYTYKDIATLNPSGTFGRVAVDLWVPEGVKNLTVFHVIKNVGELTMDDVVLKFKSAATGIFTTGAVSLSFDDGWLSQYQNAIPKMNAAGLKGTFYIVTEQMADDNFPGYMSEAQVKEVYEAGHEIGAHTRTHPVLSSLSPSEQEEEIRGSREDLLAMNVGPILSFAYPLGSYTATTVQIVKDADFESARSTIGGDNVTPVWDEYQLPRFSVEVNTTFDQVKQQIDSALAKKEWIILVFHQINNGSDRYTVSPVIFNQIVDYLTQTNAQVIKISEGMASMQQL